MLYKSTIKILSLFTLLIFVSGCGSSSLRTRIEDFNYLDALPVNGTFNLEVSEKLLQEYEENSHITAFKVEDLNGDNIKEIIYKSGGKIYILDNGWNNLFSCSVGVSFIEDLLIVDLNNDGLKEIITTGGEDNIFDKVKQNYHRPGGAYGARINKEPVRLEFRETVDVAFVNELKEYASDLEVINDKEIAMSKASWDYLNSEHFELKILDNECNLVSKYFISEQRKGTSIILSTDIDNDSKNEIVIKLTKSGNLYYLDDNKFDLVKNRKTKKFINSEIERQKTSKISEEKIKEYHLSGQKFLEDINNDGNKEIITLISKPDIVSRVTNIYILNYSDGKVMWKYTYPDWALSIIIEDINNDGNKEIIVPKFFSKNSITIFEVPN